MTRPMDVVRARHKDTGDHYTTTRHRAALRGDTVLEGRQAVDEHGRWLPPLPHKNIQPVRDAHGRFAPVADAAGDTDQPVTGEEEA